MLDFSVLEPYIPLLATAVWITLKFTFFSRDLQYVLLSFLQLWAFSEALSWR